MRARQDGGIFADMSTAENTILGLRLPTDPRWTDLAAISLEEVLTDHAFCEQKAATQCISLIQRYSDKPGLVAALEQIVTEEWGHFRMVFAEMQKRGFKLGRQRKDEYVNALIEHMPKGVSSHEKLLHQLLVCAMIEARSCERFRLLSEGLDDDSQRKFYYKFLVSEAGHYRLFLDLAEQYFGEEKTRKAWKEWLHIEAEILKGLQPRGDRMH
jgi:tRNA-(ms[2]io[6]A)-hydroxylase